VAEHAVRVANRLDLGRRQAGLGQPVGQPSKLPGAVPPDDEREGEGAEDGTDRQEGDVGDLGTRERQGGVPRSIAVPSGTNVGVRLVPACNEAMRRPAGRA
jgi:hypothetical protein